MSDPSSPCPDCAAPLPPGAAACPACGAADLAPRPAPPAPRQEGRARGLVVLGAGAVALVAAALWLAFGGRAVADAGGRRAFVIPVTLAPVEGGAIRPTVQLTGTVRSRVRAELAFEAAGVLAEVAVDAAALVEPGQLVARLDGRAAALDVQAALAEVARCERELELLEAGARAEERRRLEAELEVSRAEAQLADIEVGRGAMLLDRKVISQADLDALRARHRAAEARVAASAERLAEAVAGAREEDLRVARARLEAARVRQRQAELDQEKLELRAPWRGAVVRRDPSAGDWVGPGQRVVELVSLEHLEVELDVPSRYAALLGAAPAAVLRLDEAPGYSRRVVLDAQVPAADERSRNFRALARLAPTDATPGAGPPDPLRPGMFVRAEVALAAIDGGAVVPSDAVRITDRGAHVVRAVPAPPPGPDAPPPGQGPPGPTHQAELVPVRVLGAEGARSAVAPLAGGLAPGDRVVLIGADMAFPGAPLLARGAAGPTEAP